MNRKLFYTGPAINADMLIVMLEKHGIAAEQQTVPGENADEEDLNRLTEVFVSESDFERAHDLFYSERQDEL